MLESGVGLFAERAALEVDLDAAAAVLQRGEAGLAHDALEHHAAGHLDRDRRGRQRLLVQAVVPGVQVGGVRIGHEIVGERTCRARPWRRNRRPSPRSGCGRRPRKC
ncbi:Uncharacterised protein [Bordetella pertussis]|nr:Uncharacterised protein [Bordetella pertussis]